MKQDSAEQTFKAWLRKNCKEGQPVHIYRTDTIFLVSTIKPDRQEIETETPKETGITS